MIRLAALAAALAAAIVVASCGSDDSSAKRSAAPVKTSDPVDTFAPLVVLHSKETSFPTTGARFLWRSTLKWTSAGCPLESVAIGRIAAEKTGVDLPILDESRIASEPFYKRSRAGCGARPDARYTTVSHTRPYDRERRAPGLKLDEGFYLDLIDGARKGARQIVPRGSQRFIIGLPTYYESTRAAVGGQPGLRISYWIFFAHTAFLKADGSATGSSHEGGWERADVMLRRAGRNAYVPASVRYHAGDSVRTVPWRDVERVAAIEYDGRRSGTTHPVAYAARESHSLYPRPGRYERPVQLPTGKTVLAVDEAEACVRCPRWGTWELLRDMDVQPWQGFGGGWGAANEIDATSGPHGPWPSPSR